MSATPGPPAAGRRSLDVDRIRRDFPILHQTVYGKQLVYLDNAASAQRPQVVIDSLVDTYSRRYANVHRGLHFLSEQTTLAYEEAREKVAGFLNAPSAREVIFVRGTTEALNLVARSFVRPRLGPGDEVLITAMEHHSNIVPWQILCEEQGARLRVAPMDDRGELDLEAYEALLGDRTRVVSLIHVSNALGTVNPVRRMTAAARARGIPVVVDGAQAVPHLPVDVQELGCDFYAFSGHKAFGPSGIGALWGRQEHLEAMPPYQGGGEMILSVTFEKTEFNVPPFRFEAGTPNIAGAIALGVTVGYLQELGMKTVAEYEAGLLAFATERLREIPGLRLIGTARQRAGVVSFVLEGVHAHDVGTILDREGIAVRAGHHCAQPVMAHFGVPATARASFAFYNTRQEVERLVAAIRTVQEVFA